MFIHESSYVDNNSVIGPETKIWNFCNILSGVVIGSNCIIGQGVSIGPNVKIGNNCKIENFVSIFNGVNIEDDVFIGPSVTFTNVINPRAFISRKSEFKNTILKKGCTIGANSTIVCGITIEEYSMIGSGSVVTKDVKSHTLVYGNPAKKQGFICKCGKKYGKRYSMVEVFSCDCMKGN